jgi:AcrR family transcriptional regulator
LIFSNKCFIRRGDMGDMPKFQFTVHEHGKGAVARRKLLEAAVLVFGRDGLEGATVRNIASAAGQNVASVGYYFGGKEGLYHALIRALAGELPVRLGDILGEVRELKERGNGTAEEASVLLQRLIRLHFLRNVSRPEMIPLSRIIVREQTEPTVAFDILYELAIKHFHESLCFLTGKASGRSPEDPEVIIRAHSLLGQMFSFVFARETILRRLGWKDLEGANAERIADVLTENIGTLMKGLEAAGRKPNSGAKKAR